MAKVRFVAFKGKSLVSVAIRFFTRSKKYSHIGYLKTDEALIECWPSKGNRFQRWSVGGFENHSPGTDYEIWELIVTDKQYKYIDWFFYKAALFGFAYDWLGCMGFVFRLVRDSRDRFFCSEGCAAPLCRHLGWESVVPSHVSPQDFVELLDAAGGYMVKRGKV
jgi:hypothetical protein